MEVLGILSLVGKILCFVIGGALTFGSGLSLCISGIDFQEEGRSATRLKADVFFSVFLPMVIAFLPWDGLWSSIAPIAYLVTMIVLWSKRREDITQFKKNWREMIDVRRVFITGVCLLGLGVLLVAFPLPLP